MTTEELLNEMEQEAELHSEETPVCVIDPEARTITVPPEYQLLGVENDKRVERIRFQCPKIVGDNQDLSQDYILFINYVNANGDPDAYKISDMQVDGDNITFSWLLEEKVTLYQGDIQISFCGIIPGDEQEDPDKNRWGTTINTDCTVLTGLECTQQVAESNPDALVQIWAAIDELKAGGGGSGTPGKDGVGIDRIEKTSTQGLVDTYTIIYTDGTTTTYTVTNGSNVTDASLSLKGVAADAYETGRAISQLTQEAQISTPAYTNKIPISLSIDGAIFNGNGIKSGYALGSDGGENVNAGLYVTGFIPVTKGDIIRVKDNGDANFDTSIMFALYPLMVDSGTNIGKTVNDIMNNELYGNLSISGNTVTWDTSTIGYYFWENFSYARFTLTSADAIVTVNEEIADTVKTEKFLSDNIKVYEKNVIANGEDQDGEKDICVVFGDSIIGMVRDSTSVTSFAEMYSGQTFYNVGFGGCMMSVHPTSGYAAFSMWALADAITSRDFSAQDEQATSGEDYFQEQLNKLKSIDFSDVDYIIIHYGTNDFGGNVSIKNNENEEDTNTLCGALRYSLNKIQSTYKNIKIFISVPIFRMWDTVGSDAYENSNGNKLTDFVEALVKIAEEYHLPVINGYKDLGINLKNGSHFLTDGTHLSNAGRKNFGQYISKNVF